MKTAVFVSLGALGLVSAQGFDYFVHPADASGPPVADQAGAQPPKNQWLTNAVFQTAFARVTDSVADGVANPMASVVYSRWTPLNSSQELLFLQRNAGGPDGLIYSATTHTLLKTLPTRILIDGVPDQEFSSMEAAEVRWDYSARYPARFYYVSGPRFLQYDTATDTAHVVHDFSVAAEFPGAEAVMNGVEGDSSGDSRYWAWMVRGGTPAGGSALAAIITFDKEEDRIVGRLDPPGYRARGGQYPDLPVPNMVEISPSGRKVIYHLGRCWGDGGMGGPWTRSTNDTYWTSVPGVTEPISRVEERDRDRRLEEVQGHPNGPGTYAHDRAAERLYVWCADSGAPANHGIYWEYGNRPKDLGTVFDGPHAWDLDFTHPVKVSVDETHSGWTWSFAGHELFVSQNNREDWIEARDPESGAVMRCLYQGDFGWGNGWHFARMPAATPGWILISTYREGENTNWGDNQLFMLEMKDQAAHPRVWRLGSTHNQYDSYYTEAFAAMSQKGDRFWWGARWPGQPNIETYEMRLPAQWWRELAGEPALRLVTVRGARPGQIELQWPPVANRVYTVYTTTNLAEPFTVLTNGLRASPPLNVCTDLVQQGSCRFYRVSEQP